MFAKFMFQEKKYCARRVIILNKFSKPMKRRVISD